MYWYISVREQMGMGKWGQPKTYQAEIGEQDRGKKGELTGSALLPGFCLYILDFILCIYVNSKYYKITNNIKY